jgi:hypothetical protein
LATVGFLLLTLSVDKAAARKDNAGSFRSPSEISSREIADEEEESAGRSGMFKEMRLKLRGKLLRGVRQIKHHTQISSWASFVPHLQHFQTQKMNGWLDKYSDFYAVLLSSNHFLVV